MGSGRGVDYVILHRDASGEMRVPFEDARGRSGWIMVCRRDLASPSEDAAIVVLCSGPPADARARNISRAARGSHDRAAWSEREDGTAPGTIAPPEATRPAIKRTVLGTAISAALLGTFTTTFAQSSPIADVAWADAGGGEADRYLRKIGPQWPLPPERDALRVGPARLRWRGEWAPATRYGLNDAVSFGASSFLSLTDDNVVEPGSDPRSGACSRSRARTGSDGFERATARASGATGAATGCDGSNRERRARARPAPQARRATGAAGD